MIGKQGYRNTHIRQEKDKIYDYINYDITIDPSNNKFNDIVDKYNEKEDIYKLNWQEESLNIVLNDVGEM